MPRMLTYRLSGAVHDEDLTAKYAEKDERINATVQCLNKEEAVVLLKAVIREKIQMSRPFSVFTGSVVCQGLKVKVFNKYKGLR